MILDLDYNDKDFRDKIINLPKCVKTVNIYGDNINISSLCDVLENVKSNVEIRCNNKEKINNEFLNSKETILIEAPLRNRRFFLDLYFF